MSFVRRLLPAPLLSAALLALWLTLARDASTGQILLGLALALFVPRATASLRPTKVRVRRPLVIARKISGGTRSAGGSQTRMVLQSLVATWELRGQDPLAAMLDLLRAPRTTSPKPAPL